MYHHILVPLDGSKMAESALPHVITMAKKGAVGEVTLLHVVNVYTAGCCAYPGYVDTGAMQEGLLAESRTYLAEMESRLASEGIPVKIESQEGNRPADTIADYAEKNGVDLIVISTHGYSGLKKLMLGSVALEVLHDSHVPVLLVRPEPSGM